MINFWVFSGFLTLLACLFLLFPIVRIKLLNSKVAADQSEAITREKENITIYKDRLSELEIEKSKNLISEALYQQRRADLETALLNDVNETSSSPVETKNTIFSLAVVIFSIVFVCVFSFWFYQINGAKPMVDKYHSMNFDAKELEKARELAQQGDMTALLNQLYEKLKTAPENIEGWHLLARSAMNVQSYELATEAYTQIINRLDPESADAAPVYGLLAQSQYYQSEGQMNEHVNSSIQKAFSLDENELNSLGLLAIDAFTNKNYSKAKQHWLKILSVYPDHPARASIEAGIQRVDAELGITEVNEVSRSSNELTQPSIEVKVSIDPSVLTRVNLNDTVYILAKQVSGSAPNKNIPLAVSRHSVKDLPVAIVLDDSKSMAPIAKLSMAESVVVVARISKTGNPVAQSGDFEAVSSDVSLTNNEAIELIIQSEVH